MALFALKGGPQDGLVVRASGSTPIMFKEKARKPDLFDQPSRGAVWREDLKWYEDDPDYGTLAADG